MLKIILTIALSSKKKIFELQKYPDVRCLLNVQYSCTSKDVTYYKFVPILKSLNRLNFDFVNLSP